MELLEGKTLRIALRRSGSSSTPCSTCRCRSPRRSAPRTRRASSTGTSSPRTSSSPRAGQAKVLDFGLAKLVAEGESAAETATGCRTVRGCAQSAHDHARTDDGHGRVHVAGASARRTLDARTDIFSFGAVVYEMVTGRLPFQGATTGVVFDGILNRAPATLREINPAAPAELVHILDKALEKDRELRYQSIREMRADLARLKRDAAVDGRIESPSLRAPPKTTTPLHGRRCWRRPRAWSSPWPGMLLWAQPCAGAGRDGATPSALTRVTFDDGLQAQPAWSPDGQFIAYSSNQSGNFDIWVQPIGGGRAVRVTTRRGERLAARLVAGRQPLAFRSERDGGGIFVVPALGGAERKLADGLLAGMASRRIEILLVLRRGRS